MKANELEPILRELNRFFGPNVVLGKQKPKRVIVEKNYQLMAFAAGLMIGAQIDREQVMKLLEKK